MSPRHSVATRYHNRKPERPPLQQLPVDPQQEATKEHARRGSAVANQNRKARERRDGH